MPRGSLCLLSFPPADQLNATDIAGLRSKHKGASCTVPCSVTRWGSDGKRFCEMFITFSMQACLCKVASSDTRRSGPQILHVIEWDQLFFTFHPDNPIHAYSTSAPEAHEHVASKKTREATTIF
jgi:hypothetical protein